MFRWIHTCIPVLSEELIKYLQSFMPFIMGIDLFMFNYASEYLNEEENIYIINISTDNITISSLLNVKNTKKKKISKADIL